MLALVLAPMLAAASPPAHACSLPQTALTSQHATPPRAQKLGQLPDADMDLAVIRSMDGCWVRQVVRFHVSDPAPNGAEPGVHVPGFRGTLVPQGSVLAPVQPVR